MLVRIGGCCGNSNKSFLHGGTVLGCHHGRWGMIDHSSPFDDDLDHHSNDSMQQRVRNDEKETTFPSRQEMTLTNHDAQDE